MNGSNNPQSWYDLPLMQPMDPRSIISFVQFDNNAGGPVLGVFQNSATFLNNTAWVASPLSLSAGTGGTSPTCTALAGIQDYQSFVAAQQWINSHGVVRTNTQLPATVQKIIFLKSGNNFLTTFFLDFAGGVTSTDIQLSIRDNSVTGGNFLDSATGTVPAFTFSGAFGGTSRKLAICTNGPGRVSMGMRVIDNASNWSMFEMDWNIVP